MCIKCGSPNPMNGPRFVKMPFGDERLEYRCGQCGYVERTRTKDDAENLISLRHMDVLLNRAKQARGTT